MDYRVNYIIEQAKEELFSISANGSNFVLTGDKGTVLTMKPVLGKSIVVDKGDSTMTITKGGISLRAKKDKPLEQLAMEEIKNG